MSKQPYDLNENFANQFRTFLNSVEGKGLTSAQNLQRTAFILLLLSELSSKSEEWERRKNDGEEKVAESLVVTAELCKKLLTFTSIDLQIKSPKLQNQIHSVIKQLENISKVANHSETARLNEIKQSKRKIFSEGDELFRQINPPEFRYDVTQQGTGRNAYRESKNYTKSGTLSFQK